MKKLIAMGAMLAAGSAFAADGIKVWGGVDAQYNWVKTTPNTNTFNLNEGYFGFTKSLGAGEGVVDLSVKGFSKTSQAYVSWKYENGFNWKLGQWHSIYGYESVHSSDIRFSHQGMLYDAVPTSHTGLYAGYDFSDMLGLGFIVANPADQTGMTEGNPDFGVKASTKMDNVKASVGLLFSRSAAAGKSTLVDVIAGTTFGKLSVDANFILKKPDAGNSGIGFGGIFGYGVTDTVDAGARVEYTKDIAPVKMLAFTVGPQFKMSSDFTIKADYTFTKPDGGTNGHAITVAAVHKF